MQSMHGFLLGKDGSMLEVETLVVVKVSNAFLQNEKEMEPVLDLGVRKQVKSDVSVLEEEAPQLIQSSPPKKRMGRMF